jgi:competence protein ComEC
MCAIVLGRRGQILNSLYLAAIIILIFDPSALFDLSFMLSFSAVFFIGCFMERGKTPNNTEDQGSLLQRIRDRLKQGFIISMAATLGTAPLIIYVFNGISLLTPFINLFMTPFICFLILPPALIFSFIAYAGGYELMPFYDLLDQIVSWVISFIKYLSSIPYVYIHLPDPRISVIVSYYVSLYVFSRSRSWFRYLPLIVTLMIYTVGSICCHGSERLRITFLDVGQGDASFVELPDGRKMLIDSGPGTIHAGRNIIAPYLLSKGIREIDFLVLTHPHPDHYGGMFYIINNFHIKEAWLNGQNSALVRELLKRDIKIRYPKRGDVLNGRGYRIYILHPYEGFMPFTERGEYSSTNNESLVLKIEAEGHSLLLTGDIEQEAEEDLIYLGKWLESEVLKVPHHGGRTSSSSRFLETVNPVIGIVSAGENNPFNHPHDETLRRLRLHHIRLFRTDMDGSITITFNKDKISIQTCR